MPARHDQKHFHLKNHLSVSAAWSANNKRKACANAVRRRSVSPAASKSTALHFGGCNCFKPSPFTLHAVFAFPPAVPALPFTPVLPGGDAKQSQWANASTSKKQITTDTVVFVCDAHKENPQVDNTTASGSRLRSQSNSSELCTKQSDIIAARPKHSNQGQVLARRTA